MSQTACWTGWTRSPSLSQLPCRAPCRPDAGVCPTWVSPVLRLPTNTWPSPATQHPHASRAPEPTPALGVIPHQTTVEMMPPPHAHLLHAPRPPGLATPPHQPCPAVCTPMLSSPPSAQGSQSSLGRTLWALPTALFTRGTSNCIPVTSELSSPSPGLRRHHLLPAPQHWTPSDH